MPSDEFFYLCPTCFEASECELECHGHPMMRCECGQPGDERRKPPLNGGGRIKSRAPRWFWETQRQNSKPRFPNSNLAL
jgi:hypothetical protein